MIITPRHTVADVLLAKATLFNIVGERLTAKVKERPLPSKIPMYWCGFVRKRYSVRHIGFSLDGPAITLGELHQLQRFESQGLEAFTRIVGVMLRLPEEKVLKLQFIGAYKYFLEIVEELKQVAQAFATLKIPEDLKTNSDRIVYAELPSRGIPDLVSEFVGFMPQYAHKDVYNLPWVVVFREFQRRWRNNVNERKRMLVQQQEMRLKAKR